MVRIKILDPSHGATLTRVAPAQDDINSRGAGI